MLSCLREKNNIMVDTNKIKEFLNMNNYVYQEPEKLQRYWYACEVFVTTTQRVLCEDWKTAIAQGKPAIPPGTKLEIKGVIQNFYGEFLRTEYQGFNYYINPRYVDNLEVKKYKCIVKNSGGEIKVVALDG